MFCVRWILPKFLTPSMGNSKKNNMFTLRLPNTKPTWGSVSWRGDPQRHAIQRPGRLGLVDTSRWFRNPAPVEVGSLSHYLQGFSTIPGGCFRFLPSTVGILISFCLFRNPIYPGLELSSYTSVPNHRVQLDHSPEIQVPKSNKSLRMSSPAFPLDLSWDVTPPGPRMLACDQQDGHDIF